jgi:cell wall-associated NlpC family hydrolase
MERQKSPTSAPWTPAAPGSGRALSLALCLGLLLLAAQGCSTKVVRPAGPGPADPTAERSFRVTDPDQAGHVVQTARGQIGTPYVYGGHSPDQGFDCSGLVYWVYRQNGVDLPRTSWEQYQAGRPVAQNDLKPGDLIFFKIKGKGQSLHSGIYSGQDTFIHSPKPGAAVREEPLAARYWLGRYLGARRVVQDTEATSSGSPSDR